MMNPRDLAGPAAALAGTVVLAAGAAVAGYLVLSRDRERLKQAVRLAADLAERATWRFGEAREDLADLWAEARDEARRDIEERAFATAATAEGEGHAATGDGEAAASPAPARKRRAGGTKRGAAKAG